MSTSNQINALPLGTSYQIPNNLVNPAFGEINLLRYEDFVSVSLTILVDPDKEGTRTGVALDGSESMSAAFGQGWRYDKSLDQIALDQYVLDGEGEMLTGDGTTQFQAKDKTLARLRELGLATRNDNEVEPTARALVSYLAEKVDQGGATAAIYWAGGEDGEQIEDLGSLTPDEARETTFAGPRVWGRQTRLLPALKHLVERFAEAEWGFFVFVTDGKIEDLENVKDYTVDLARRIQAGEAKPVKCVLIGVGQDIDEQQMSELDDLPDETYLSVDIWDHKIAATTRSLLDIFAEVVDENSVVAPQGRVLTETGEVLANYEAGLPGVLKFDLPLSAQGFVVEAGGERFEQTFA